MATGAHRTLNDVISKVNAQLENTFTVEEETDWINSLEGRVLTDVFLQFAEDWNPYKFDQDSDVELNIPEPYADVYEYWLRMQIFLHMGEYEKYNAERDLYNTAYSSFVRYWARVYRPAQ